MVEPMNYYSVHFPYPDHMLTMSNRARLDSGTSGSSESSRGSGKPPRRRSHRPRGCRGGSNRRRNNSVEGNTRTQGSKKNVKEMKGRLENNSTIAAKSQSKQPSAEKYNAPLQEFTILTRHNHASKGSHFMRPNSFSCEPIFVSSVTSPGPWTDYGTSAKSSNFDASYYSRMNGSNSSFDCPNIQPSFSDSSSEAATDVDMFAATKNYPPTKHVEPDDILPPLPSNAFNNEQPVQTGPNPYALKHVIANDNFMPQQQLQQGGVHQIGGYAGGRPTILTTSSSGVDGYDFPSHSSFLDDMDHLGIQFDNLRYEDDYKAERLEKQRQNVVGGSLFVTSPRSFLMGLKRNFVAASEQ